MPCLSVTNGKVLCMSYIEKSKAVMHEHSLLDNDFRFLVLISIGARKVV